MPPLVSTSQIRMSRWMPSAWPLSQGSSAHGIRSMVTRMSAMVMSGFADVIGRFPLLLVFGGALAATPLFQHEGRPVTTRLRRSRVSIQTPRFNRLGNLEHQAGRGGMRQQPAFAVG